MAEFVVRLADYNFRIFSVSDVVKDYFADYLVDSSSKEDFIICSSWEKIEAERKLIPDEFPHDDISSEVSSIHRMMAESMIAKSSVLVHGSAISYKGECILIIANSGVGKSTHSRLWKENYGSDVVYVNDDKPFLRSFPNGFFVYGSPWNGKHNLSNNIKAPLKAVCVIRQAEENSIRALDKKEAYIASIEQIYRSSVRENLIGTMSFIDSLVSSVKFYEIRCNMDISASTMVHDYIFSDGDK